MKKISNIARIVKGASESAKAEFAEKRINKAVEIAKMNAEEALCIAEEKKATYTKGSKSAEQVVTDLAVIFGEIKEAKETIAVLDEVSKFLAETTEVAEDAK